MSRRFLLTLSICHVAMGCNGILGVEQGHLISDTGAQGGRESGNAVSSSATHPTVLSGGSLSTTENRSSVGSAGGTFVAQGGSSPVSSVPKGGTVAFVSDVNGLGGTRADTSLESFGGTTSTTATTTTCSTCNATKIRIGGGSERPLIRPETVTGCVLTTNGCATVLGSQLGGRISFDVCPESQVLVGMKYYAADLHQDGNIYFGGIQAACAPLGIGEQSVFVGGDSLLSRRGDSVPQNEMHCASNQVVTGFDGYAPSTREAPTAIRLSCSTLALSGSEFDATLKVSSGDATEMAGAIAGNASLLSTNCTDGDVAIGLVIRSGLWVDAIGILCGPPQLAFPTGAPCVSGLNCDSAVCRNKKCEDAPCLAPNGCTCASLGDRAYWLCGKAATQNQAAVTCNQQNMTLAVASDRLVLGWLASEMATIQAPSFWLDAFAELDRWYWANNDNRPIVPQPDEDAFYNFWASSNAGDRVASATCLTLTDGHYQSADCAKALPFACQTKD